VTLIVMVIYRLCERRIPLRPLGPLSRRMAMIPLVVYALNGLTDVLAGYPEATRLLPPFVMGIPLLLAGNRLWAWSAQREAGDSTTAAPAGGKAVAR
jgi:hypothetical protein